jgi:hypothetical protein
MIKINIIKCTLVSDSGFINNNIIVNQKRIIDITSPILNVTSNIMLHHVTK